MRLIHSESLRPEEFPDAGGYTPSYAILSHCWTDGEVLYQHIIDGTASSRRAYPKVVAAAAKAKAAGYDWIWCDTCCIDKNSSAELSEAINSMFAWYNEAAVCYAYLDDITHQDDKDGHYNPIERLDRANWFNRGWTLQELIAPKKLIFFDRQWNRIGSRNFAPVRDIIHKRTNIDTEILDDGGFRHLDSVSVAKRMSWAAGRKVKRPEDRAYSLMGIFGVTMPMIYGEGALNAFHRLQEQIMKGSNDHSIFAWSVSADTKISEPHGLLADDPDAFASASTTISYNDYEYEASFQPSNAGLRIDLHLTPTPALDGTFYAALNCPVPPIGRGPPDDLGYYGFVVIILKKLDVGINQYARIKCSEKLGMDFRAERPTTVHVRQKPPLDDERAVMPWHFFQPRRLDTESDEYELLNVAHFELPASEQRYLPRPMVQKKAWLASAQASSFQVIRRAGKLSAILKFRRTSDGARLLLLLGSIEDLKVGFAIQGGGATQDISLSTLDMKNVRFEPPGCWMESGNHKVCVNVEVKVDGPRKLYILDITIDGRQTPPPSPPPSPRATLFLGQSNVAPVVECVADLAKDFAEDIQSAATDPRWRPLGLIKRIRNRAKADKMDQSIDGQSESPIELEKRLL